MFGSIILDVAVGLVMVYLLLSLVTSAVREGLAGILKTRASMLQRGIAQLLQDPKLIEDFYEHPLIFSLYQGETYADAKQAGTLPSYIPAAAFAKAMIDLVARGRDLQAAASPNAPPISLAAVRQNVAVIRVPRVQRALLAAVDHAQGNLDIFQTQLEDWFNGAMDRVSGWYKRQSQIIIFVVGCLLTVLCDVDTLHVAKRLYSDPAQRQVAVAMASGFSSKDTAMATAANASLARLDTLGLPMMWNGVIPASATSAQAKLEAIGDHAWRASFGWLLTALAISLGAPFWFDVLNRIMMIRSSLKPGETSATGGSAPTPPVIATPAAVVAPPQAPVTLPPGATVPGPALPAPAAPPVAGST